MKKSKKIKEIKLIRDRWQKNANRIKDEAWEYHTDGKYVNYSKFMRESKTIQHFVNDLNEILEKSPKLPSF